ncbi:50S ribosomal protein L16 [Candidatus Woesearchaeota archaeon]|jgi:large subunit ribosomal protein L10e|nr:50S ribosomal protein L16 [Candidatus Woesearchaeota archaeon]
MALRRSNSYSKKHVVPYTRTSKRKQKAYVKVIPPSKIVKFTMGNLNAYKEGKFSKSLSLVMEEKVQIRQNALEAVRQFINKKLDSLMKDQYLFKVIPYPHHIQRENKMLTGAGADRMQTGMQLSFGRPIAKAAILNKGNEVFSIHVSTDKNVSLARGLLKQIYAKIPGKKKIIYRERTEKKI